MGFADFKTAAAAVDAANKKKYSTTVAPKVVYAAPKAPTTPTTVAPKTETTPIGTINHTNGGDYKVVTAGTPGASYNPSSGLWSTKVNQSTVSDPYAVSKSEDTTSESTATDTSTNYLNDIYDALDTSTTDQSANILASLKAAYDTNKATLEAQKPAIQQTAQSLRDSTDSTYYTQSLPALYQAMEAAGQAGGENITGRVALEAQRGNSQNAVDTYEANQLANLRTAENTLASTLASDTASAKTSLSESTLAEKLAAIKDAMNMYTTNQATAKSDFTNNITAYSSDYASEINKLQAKLNAGQTNDTDGVSLTYKINALTAARAAKLAETDAATSLSYAEALALYNSGIKTAAVLKKLGIN